ncbi:hypothetical protein BH24ACT26_BH24ACT26_07030 [soil metagenome]
MGAAHAPPYAAPPSPRHSIDTGKLLKTSRIGCFERHCSEAATHRRFVQVAGKLEELWTCPTHSVTCLAYGCDRKASERTPMQVDGKLEILWACPKHGTSPFKIGPKRSRRAPLLRPRLRARAERS